MLMCKSSDVKVKATTTFITDEEVSPLLLRIFPVSSMVSDGCYSWKDSVADSALDKKKIPSRPNKVKQYRFSVSLAQSMLHPNCRILHPLLRDLSQLGGNGPAAWLTLLN